MMSDRSPKTRSVWPTLRVKITRRKSGHECGGLCDTMFTVHSTLTWAVLTGQTDWVCQHWDPYAVRRGGCLELYYCNMVEWFWWDSSLISTTNQFSFSALTLLVWSSGLQKLSPKWPRYYVSNGTLNLTPSLTQVRVHGMSCGLCGSRASCYTFCWLDNLLL